MMTTILKKEFPNTTLMGLTTRDHHTTLLALRHASTLIEFTNVIYFSDIDPMIDDGHIVEDIENFTYFPCPKFIEYADVCIWFMTQSFKYTEHMQDHILSVHWDGYPVMPEAWDDKFFDYDYVGSPWPCKIVGNNGFWLFSKNLLAGIKSLNLPPTAEACHGCDKKISIEYRQRLIDFGVKFCPYELAFKFSTETYGYHENPLGFKYNGSFGFHGLYSIATMEKYLASTETPKEVNIPNHHIKWLDFKDGNDSQLLSVPEFLANN